ncbi:MAG: metallophosphoesterase [Sphaerochaetaceae bacterium]|nr:metallophosphoesterase [Sphaerochaetaceae bacterium]
MRKIMLMLLIAFSALIIAGCSGFGVDEDDRKGSFEQSYDALVDESRIVPSDGSGPFSVMVVTDAHFGRSARDSGVFEKYNEIQSWYESHKAEIDYTISLGDATDDSLEAEYVQSKAFLDSISNGMFLAVPGNHDVRDGGRQRYSQIYGRPQYFRIVLHGISFYFLDNANRTLGFKQLSQLEKAMENDDNRKVVITHYPVYPTLEVVYGAMSDSVEVSKLVDLFTSNNTSLVLTGHYHRKNITSHYSSSCTELVLRPCHGRKAGYIDTTPASWFLFDFDPDAGMCKVTWYYLEEGQSIPSSEVWGTFSL